MRLTEMFPSKFVKPEDVDTPVTVTIESVEQRDISGDGSLDFRWLLRTKELTKPVLLSWTLGNNIVAVLESDDTKDWEYRRIILYRDPYVFNHGVMTGAIRAREYIPEPVGKKSHGVRSQGRYEPGSDR
jgi:hypothetical protein